MTHFKLARGNLSGTSKCFIAGRHKCNKLGRWYVFPAGPGTLDTTQFSNLAATPCDKHLLKALRRVEAERKLK